MSTTILHAATAAIALLLAGTVQAQTQPSPAQKGKSAEKKATPSARSSYDIKKGSSTSRKKSDGAASTAKPREGITANGTSAQGAFHD